MKRVIGEELGEKLTRIWNLNDEGELNGIGREIGIPGLWYFSGTFNCLALCSSVMLTFT